MNPSRPRVVSFGYETFIVTEDRVEDYLENVKLLEVLRFLLFSLKKHFEIEVVITRCKKIVDS